ncbi:MAG: hypothetical protein ACTHLE_09140 [Agriterribacter sp.]
MTLQELQDQLKNANPEQVPELAAEFDRILQDLCYVHPDYFKFNEQYRSDINDLKANGNPENGNELSWYIEVLLEMSKKLKNK